MVARRIDGRPPNVTLHFDEEEVSAIEGEPVALALLAAGKRVLARSVKYHRPRGPSCLSGRCDGCLLRVDGVPSVTTCRLPARHGMKLTSQNAFGSAASDLLAATDFLFPAGVNHHEMFTWSQPVNRAMQLVAREIAGVGTLPDAPIAPLAVERRAVDLLVVGAGAAGLSGAARAARAGLSVLVFDEEPAAGGFLRRWPCAVELDGAPIDARTLAAELEEDARAAGAEVVLRASALGAFKETGGVIRVLATTPDRTIVVEPQRLLIAQGRAETGWAFAGNDLPGIFGVDAALRALSGGVLLGERPALFGDGAALEALGAAMRAAGARPSGPHPLTSLGRARGRSGVTSVDVEGVGRLKCDALIVASPDGAVFELAAQAGAEVAFNGAAFEVRASEVDGATRSSFVRVVGGASATMTLERALVQARAAADVFCAERVRDAAEAGR